MRFGYGAPDVDGVTKVAGVQKKFPKVIDMGRWVRYDLLIDRNAIDANARGGKR